MVWLDSWTVALLPLWGAAAACLAGWKLCRFWLGCIEGLAAFERWIENEPFSFSVDGPFHPLVLESVLLQLVLPCSRPAGPHLTA